MGWSEYTVRPEVDTLFKKLGKKYRLSWVNAPYPQVRIQYEGSMLHIKDAQFLVALFPEYVYVQFDAGVPFSTEEPGNTFEYED